MQYQTFLASKQHSAALTGFAPVFRPDFLFDFQAALVDWAVNLGRAAIFADCGLGKTPIQLTWAQNIVQHTNRPVLIVAPLAVSAQTIREADKFAIPAVRSQDGRLSGRAEIVVTNYERLQHFDPSQFAGLVCDESSILKNFDGATKAAITEFARCLPYRLLCTATAAPNDYIELGTSSEAIGQLGYIDMLSMFFKNDEGTIAPMSYSSQWRFKPHAERPFWRWLCSWARAVRKPSDLGFTDGAFILPRLTERLTVVHATRPADGRLFVLPAKSLQEQRAERRLTLTDRCEQAATIASGHTRPYLAWCHLNDEAATMKRLLPDAVEVSGADEDEAKIEKFEAFALGQVRGLITKPKIGGFGLNWQHCADMTTFPSHSYEQYYQGIRRCWRYGQTHDVTVDIVSTEGEADVMGNLRRKAEAADKMFQEMVAAMHDAMGVSAPRQSDHGPVTVPNWLQTEVMA
jgi:hypothetical protein